MRRRDRKYMPGVCQSADVNFASGSRAFYPRGTTGYNSKAGGCMGVQILRTSSLSAGDVRAVTLAISCALPNGRHSNAAISPAGTSVFGYEKDLRFFPFLPSLAFPIALLSLSLSLSLVLFVRFIVRASLPCPPPEADF